MVDNSSVANQEVLPRNDQIFRETRWLAAFIIPFLVVAFVLLFFWPDRTEETFAWTIVPSMTSMMLASAYIGGVYFFAGVILAKRWHHIKVGFLPVTAFASILGVATLLHWDRFNHSHVSFFAWTALYFTAPFLVALVWLRNRVTDPGIADREDASIPVGLRGAMAVVGVITIVISGLLFLRPDLMIAVWPWQLTPLTARVVSAMFVLPGLVGLGIAADARWSSARLILQSQAFSIAFILISAARAWDDFDRSSPSAYVFVGGLVLLLIGIVAFYWAMESRRSTPEGT